LTLPPVESFSGTMPIHAARCRFSNNLASVTRVPSAGDHRADRGDRLQARAHLARLVLLAQCAVAGSRWSLSSRTIAASSASLSGFEVGPTLRHATMGTKCQKRSFVSSMIQHAIAKPLDHLLLDPSGHRVPNCRGRRGQTGPPMIPRMRNICASLGYRLPVPRASRSDGRLCS
jgi:hypothetical protein